MRRELSLNNEDVFVRNLAFFFMLGFLVYHWFSFPPMLWRIGLVVICLYGILRHLKALRFNSVEKSMGIFVLINVVYFFISFLWQIPSTTNFGNILCSTLPLFLFYYLSARGAVTDRSIMIFTLLTAITGVAYFRHAQEIYLLEHYYSEEGSSTINASTIFLVIIPLLTFVKNRYVVLLIAAECILFLLLGAKRGNLVSAAIPLIILLSSQIKGNNTLLNKVVIFACIIAIIFLSYSSAIENDYLTQRFNDTLEGDTSNREFIYGSAWEVWATSNSAINMLFGYGTDATVHLIKIRAHNDWLEILVDFGLLGVITYVAFFISIIKMLNGKQFNSQNRIVVFMVFLIWFSKSMYSMGFTNDIFSFLSMSLGVALGRSSKTYTDRNSLVINQK